MEAFIIKFYGMTMCLGQTVTHGGWGSREVGGCVCGGGGGGGGGEGYDGGTML